MVDEAQSMQDLWSMCVWVRLGKDEGFRFRLITKSPEKHADLRKLDPGTSVVSSEGWGEAQNWTSQFCLKVAPLPWVFLGTDMSAIVINWVNLLKEVHSTNTF
jgi:hypothetical protein